MFERFKSIILASILFTTISMTSKVAVVTGANKGIGKEIALKLSTEGVKTIIACRDEVLGLEAQNDINKNGGVPVEFRLCDIGSKESIIKFISSLEKDYPKVDILVNNAAIAFKSSDPTPFRKQARPTISVNFFGTLELTQCMLPLLKKSTNPRIVNVASQAGQLRILKSLERRAQFTSPTLTVEELCDLMSNFVKDVEEEKHQMNDWPNTCYGTSKLGVVALTKVLARTNPEIVTTACCPGYCATDMSSNGGPRSAKKGAETPAFLALHSEISQSSLFFYDMSPMEWE